MWTAVLIALAALVVLFVLLHPFKPGRKSVGNYVAEVWLEWEVCRGSTLYRQCFRTKAAARCFAKLYAWRLDMRLPKVYYTEGWAEGSFMANRYDYEIHYGIRCKTKQEYDRFRRILSTVLPGHEGYTGEHADANPLRTQAALSADTGL